MIQMMKARPSRSSSVSRSRDASVPVSRVAELDYVLTPGRYVGLPEEEDDFNFAERFTALKAEFEEQLKEEERLNKLILENLGKIKIEKEEA